MGCGMSTKRIYTAAIVIIGDEILSGRTQDKNISQIALWLNIQGIRLKEVRVVADDMDAISEAVNILRARNDYLFTTGGIGPTHDDITVDAISQALGVDVDQGNGAAAFARNAHDIVEQARGEETAGPEKSDFDRTRHDPGESEGRGVLRVGSVTAGRFGFGHERGL